MEKNRKVIAPTEKGSMPVTRIDELNGIEKLAMEIPSKSVSPKSITSKNQNSNNTNKKNG